MKPGHENQGPRARSSQASQEMTLNESIQYKVLKKNSFLTYVKQDFGWQIEELDSR